MYFCDNCNFVANNYRQYIGHLGQCCNKKKKIYINTNNSSNTNDHENDNSFNDIMESDIEYGIVNDNNRSENGINVENLSNTTEYELSNNEDDHSFKVSNKTTISERSSKQQYH